MAWAGPSSTVAVVALLRTGLASGSWAGAARSRAGAEGWEQGGGCTVTPLGVCGLHHRQRSGRCPVAVLGSTRLPLPGSSVPIKKKGRDEDCCY